MVYAHKHALSPVFEFLSVERKCVGSISFNPEKVLLMKYSVLTIISQSRGKFIFIYYLYLGEQNVACLRWQKNSYH